eukprot:SAG31_NODE_11259_length_1049_cov_1.089474_1_plen_85_part_10
MLLSAPALNPAPILRRMLREATARSAAFALRPKQRSCVRRPTRCGYSTGTQVFDRALKVEHRCAQPQGVHGVAVTRGNCPCITEA